MSPVYVALIVATSSVLSPLLLAIITYILQESGKERDAERHRKERQEDKADAAAVAQKVDAVQEQAKEAAALLVDSTKETKNTLQEIHVAVNSKMTAEKQRALAATKRELVLLLELQGLKLTGGSKPSLESTMAIESARTDIAALEAELRDRLTSQPTPEN